MFSRRRRSKPKPHAILSSKFSIAVELSATECTARYWYLVVVGQRQQQYVIACQHTKMHFLILSRC